MTDAVSVQGVVTSGFFAAVVTVIVAGGDAAVPRGKLTRVVAHTHSKIGGNNIDFSLLLVDEDF